MNKQTEKSEEQLKLEALCEYLQNSDSEEVQALIDDKDYLVLTDHEADVKARENILDSVWAFNASFLESHTGLDAEAIKIIQKAKCEGANETFKRVIDDLDSFIEDAISSDGRGHFMNSYDGEENEQNGFYIYRMN